MDEPVLSFPFELEPDELPGGLGLGADVVSEEENGEFSRQFWVILILLFGALAPVQ